MSDRIRSLTLFTAFLFAAACGGGSSDGATGASAGSPSAQMTSPTTQTPATAMQATPMAMCGNNKAEGAEPCDGTDLKGQTCASINPGSTGMLRCNSCKLDTLMCLTTAAAMPMGGAGAAQGGSGARTTGSAGAGGSGRM